MDKHSDVLIIGGGIIGIACAYFLARAGRSVRIIEQERIGSGASHGNCGLIFSSHLFPLCSPGTVFLEIKRMLSGYSPLYIKPEMNIRRLVWLLKFAGKCNPRYLNHAIKSRKRILKESKILYENLFETENMESRWQTKGILLIFKTEAGMKKYARTNEVLRLFGMDAKAYTGSELFNLEPALNRDVYGGWYHESDTHVKPDLLLNSWKNVLIHKGVVIQEDCRLINLISNSRRVIKAETSKNDFTADEYVLTTGAWTSQIAEKLKLNLPIEPAKGYSITMDKPEICPEIPCYFVEKGAVVTPWEKKSRIGGTMEFSGFDFSIHPRRIQRLKYVSAEYLKKTMEASVSEEWVGIRPMTYDDIPVIDRSPGLRNLIIATGHGTTGMSMAPGTGKLVAEMITGQYPHIDPAPYRITRF